MKISKILNRANKPKHSKHLPAPHAPLAQHNIIATQNHSREHFESTKHKHPLALHNPSQSAYLLASHDIQAIDQQNRLSSSTSPTSIQKIKSLSQVIMRKITPRNHLFAQKSMHKPPAQHIKQNEILDLRQNPQKAQPFRIIIENLVFKCIIGLLPKERAKKQRIIINANIAYVSENNAFIDYERVVKIIKKSCKHNAYKLLESALQDITHTLKAHFPPITSVKISIKKPEILSSVIVGVEYETDFLKHWRDF